MQNPYLAHRSNNTRSQRRLVLAVDPYEKPRKEKQSKSKDTFAHGNYTHYYGYRLSSTEMDPRLECLEKSWFMDKTVLDIGCNAGNVTMDISLFLGAKSVVGVDIDPLLIKKARSQLCTKYSLMHEDQVDYFPLSAVLEFGHLHLPKTSHAFPGNVEFRLGDWIHEPMPANDEDRFDVLLALSITKWIHLHGGDGGIKYFFQKCIASLKPGGKLIVEPQPFETYEKRAHLTTKMLQHYNRIRFKPEQFVNHLVQNGLVHLKTVYPEQKTKGFQRPIHVLEKPCLC